jgi:hypothetical protein
MEPLETEPELPSPGWAADDLLRASLELIHVPRGEDDLFPEELGFQGGNPDQEICGKRDCEKKS